MIETRQSAARLLWILLPVVALALPMTIVLSRSAGPTPLAPTAEAAWFVALAGLGPDDADTPDRNPTAEPDRWNSSSWALRGVRPVAPDSLTDEMIDICLEVASDLDPALGQRLKDLRRDDPARFTERLRRSYRLIALAETKLRDPNMYGLKKYELTIDATVLRVAAELRDLESPDPAREQALRNHLRVQLAFSHKARDEYLCQLEELVKRLRDELQYERENADEIVEERLESLLERTPSGDVAPAV